MLETNLFIVFLAGENGSCNLISWQSKKLKHEAQISLTSETLAMLDVREIKFKLLNGLTQKNSLQMF